MVLLWILLIVLNKVNVLLSSSSVWTLIEDTLYVVHKV